MVGVAENLASGAGVLGVFVVIGVLGVLLQLIKLANASMIKARTAAIFAIAVHQLSIIFAVFLRLTGALLMASGRTSGEVNIVPLSERILTFGRGDGESYGVVTVFGIGVSRVLLGAVNGAIVIEVPGPTGYITC